MFTSPAPQLNLPDPDRRKLERSPLELVVCQLRYEFSPRVGEVQTALAFHRALGGKEGPFSEMQQASTQEAQLIIGPQAPPVATARSSVSGWRFTSRDTPWIVSLMPDNVSLETTAYETWSGFRSKLDVVLDAVAQYVQPGLEERLGLRYIDRIKELELRSPNDWRPFIAEELLGLVCHPALGTTVRTGQQVLQLELGQASCLLRHGFLQDASGGDRVDYLLDLDIYRASGCEFEPGQLKQAADDFNTLALQLFQALVTPELLERLR